ncbi:hypothetical protein PFMC_02960 [Plasmodium falciparum CAMP/Malaysia]|uniref:EF-hand domain-containing protein n=1 Tax=Plasmodium falciparum (isolate Camp / Malaysia) TaxID=5835 RepID=A0A024X6B9_PLAFC|nr:hypothetical protein PFMC_02960 [Plasmodium falciparum CAMP/Malaysia]
MNKSEYFCPIFFFFFFFFFSILFIFLRRVSRELGENLSDDELQAMIDEFDKDMDGEISQEEFLSIMKQTSLY